MADEEEYSVEKILDKRTRGGKTEYLIKWEGYPDRYSKGLCVNHARSLVKLFY